MASTCGTLEVLPAFDEGSVQVRSGSCSLSGQATAGEQVTVDAVVENGNDGAATVTVQWVAVDLTGQPVLAQQTNVTVSGGGSETASSTFTAPDGSSSDFPNPPFSSAVRASVADVVNASGRSRSPRRADGGRRPDDCGCR